MGSPPQAQDNTRWSAHQVGAGFLWLAFWLFAVYSAVDTMLGIPEFPAKLLQRVTEILGLTVILPDRVWGVIAWLVVIGLPPLWVTLNWPELSRLGRQVAPDLPIVWQWPRRRTRADLAEDRAKVARARASTDFLSMLQDRDRALAEANERAAVDRAERDRIAARLQEIEEGRPQLRLEPFVRRVARLEGPTIRHEAGVRVVNDRSSVLVQDIYARIVECSPFVAGKWPGAETLRKLAVQPYFQTATIRLVEGEEGNFHGDAHFVVADIGARDKSVHLAIPEPVRSRCPLSHGPYGVTVEVGVANPGMEPVYGRFQLSLTGSGERLSFQALTDLTEQAADPPSAEPSLPPFQIGLPPNYDPEIFFDTRPANEESVPRRTEALEITVLTTYQGERSATNLKYFYAFNSSAEGHPGRTDDDDGPHYDRPMKAQKLVATFKPAYQHPGITLKHTMYVSFPFETRCQPLWVSIQCTDQLPFTAQLHVHIRAGSRYRIETVEDMCGWRCEF